MIIRSIREAEEYIKKVLKEKYGITVVRSIPFNYNRNRILICKVPERGFTYTVKYYLIFQRKPLIEFKRIFNFPSAKGGYAIREEILEYCRENKIKYIFFVNEVGTVYKIDPFSLYYLAKKYGWIRKRKDTGEVLYHIPTLLLDKLNVS